MSAKMYVLKGCLVSVMVMAVVMWAQTSSIKKQGESSEMKETVTGTVSNSLCGVLDRLGIEYGRVVRREEELP